MCIRDRYEIYHRASCWCCPFQRIDELRKLRKHHPELWEKLLELDRRALAQFGTGPLGQFLSLIHICTSLKHFAANNQEYKRFNGNSQVDERTLRELYLLSLIHIFALSPHRRRFQNPPAHEILRPRAN